jgi:hypothetical protein
MMADALLTEVQRQRKYLDKLPEDFVFPLFNATRAFEENSYSRSMPKARFDNLRQFGSNIYSTSRRTRPPSASAFHLTKGGGQLLLLGCKDWF